MPCLPICRWTTNGAAACPERHKHDAVGLSWWRCHRWHGFLKLWRLEQNRVAFLWFMYVVAFLENWEYIKTMQEWLCLNVKWNWALGLDNCKQGFTSTPAGSTFGYHAHWGASGILSCCSLKASSAPQPLWPGEAIHFQKVLYGPGSLPRSDGVGGPAWGPSRTSFFLS